MFQVNDRLYFWVLKPVAQVYRAVIPEGLRVAFADFFYNLAAPARVANNLLQGKPLQAGAEIGRFLVNSTVGILGMGNPAKMIPALNPPEEDLGQTFGAYGMGHGFYLVWPLLGPSSLRDTIGFAGDGFLNPVAYVDPSWVPAAANGLKAVNATSLRIGDYESFKAAAVEPYLSMRDAYMQLRKKKVSE
jgi:phospholipid-binding lipoprotein MlaA